MNDYVELYNSRTSPYLRDSDSDGIDDKAEIDQGTDPNCPKGQDCGLPVAAPANLNIGNTNEFFKIHQCAIFKSSERCLERQFASGRA